MPGYFNVVIVGDATGVQAMLMRLDMALSPPELGRFMNSMVDPWLRERTALRFRAEGDDVSGKWLPLQASTERIRVRDGYPPSHPINRRSGRMEDYLVGTASTVSAYNGGAKLVYPGSAAQGETRDKVRVAQLGEQNQGKGINPTPPRPVLGMNERDLEAILVGLARHIQFLGVTP